MFPSLWCVNCSRARARARRHTHTHPHVHGISPRPPPSLSLSLSNLVARLVERQQDLAGLLQETDRFSAIASLQEQHGRVAFQLCHFPMVCTVDLAAHPNRLSCVHTHQPDTHQTSSTHAPHQIPARIHSPPDFRILRNKCYNEGNSIHLTRQFARAAVHEGDKHALRANALGRLT